MAVHPVRRTLERDVLPYLISARRLRKQWFYRLHVVFGYVTDLVVALTTVGVATPIIKLLGATAEASSQDNAKPVTISEALASVPAWLYIPTGILIIAWFFLRVAFNREDGQKRAVLARSCTSVLRQAEASLPALLSAGDPMPKVLEMLERSVRPTVDRNIQENSWPWTPFAPDIDAEVDREVVALCRRYETDWQPISGIDLRQPAGGAS